MNQNCGCGLNLVFPQGEYAGYPGLGFKMPIVKFGDKTTVVEETTVAFAKDGDNAWYKSGDNPLTGFTAESFLLNTLYTITWDGVPYECFYQSRGYFYGGADNTTHYNKLLGNPTDIGFDAGYPTDAPFCIVQSWPDEYEHIVIYAFDSTAASHTIKIEKTPYTVTLIPPQYYLPTSSENGVALILEGSGDSSSIINQGREASGEYSFACGQATIASGHTSFASGIGSRAKGKASFTEGVDNEASGTGSHAEGIHSVASGNYTHAEGNGSVASNSYAHAEGGQTTASGNCSHAEGVQTVASGKRAHAQGSGTIANHLAQHAMGEFNVADPSAAADTARGTYIEIVGNGTADNDRSNARTLDWEGNETLAGSLTLGSTTITEAQLQALLALL